MKNVENVELLSVRDVARLLRCSEGSVRMKIYRGQLPVARRFGGRIIFIRSELEEYLKSLPKAVPQLREARRRNKAVK